MIKKVVTRTLLFIEGFFIFNNNEWREDKTKV